MKKLTTSEFISRSRKIHGDTFDYSLVEYTTAHKHVSIICKQHGEFNQLAYMHMYGDGCPKCGELSRRLKNKQTALLRRKFDFTQPLDYKLIPLTNGKFAKVDNEDFEELSKINWQYHAKRNYVVSNLGRMHRLIMSCPNGMHVDHINHDRLDNRRSNLRICTPEENTWNTRSLRKSSSKFKGVSYFKKNGKWRASISFKGKFISLGYFINEVDAAIAYDIAALKYYKDFGCLNFPDYNHKDLSNAV